MHPDHRQLYSYTPFLPIATTHPLPSLPGAHAEAEPLQYDSELVTQAGVPPILDYTAYASNHTEPIVEARPLGKIILNLFS